MTRYLGIVTVTVALMACMSDSLSAQQVEQCELSYHTASDAAVNSNLGSSVAIFGDLMVGGAKNDDGAADNAGAAYVFARVAGEWSEVQKLVASDAAPDAHFGGSVATDSVRIAVGASGAAGAGPNTGKVYVYHHDGVGWIEEAQLTAGPEGAAGDEFGRRVAIAGSRILVASHLDDGDGVDAGSVHAFVYDGAAWADDGILTPSDPSSGKQFGHSVAIVGDRGVIGAIGDDEVAENAGAAYVFDHTGSGWAQAAKLVASDAAFFDSLGHAVAIDGSLIAAAALGAHTGDGAVYVYEHDGLAWQSTQVLRPRTSLQERFGSAVAIDNGVIAIGEELGDLHFGAGWVFQRIGAAYRATDHLQPSIRVGHDWGGRAIDISGGTVVLGAEGQDIVGLGTGALWMFEVSAEDCGENGFADRCEVQEDCNSNGEFDACDIRDGTSTDCDADAKPDECQTDADCNGNGLFDACEPDCDGNGLPDTCDIALGSLTDCGINGIPDVCESDCNDNGVPDDCDILAGGSTDCNGNTIPDDCDLLAGAPVDCNGNGALDACDVADGTSFDTDGNCIPDECDQNPAMQPDPSGRPTSRFLSFVTVDAGCNMAIRVKMVSLTPPGVEDKFTSFEGAWRWVGPSTVHADPTNEGVLYNRMARLHCTPHFDQWGPMGPLHVYGPEVMPDSVYDVQFFDGDCGDENDTACFSTALTLSTGHWGDVDPPYFGEPNSGFQPDIRDVAAVVRKFVGESSPTRVAADLDGNVLNRDAPIDFRDISTCVTAVVEQPYPFDGPVQCP